MGKIYVGQTKLQIILNVGQDITGATSLLIKYIKPNGDTGSWVAAIHGDAKDGDVSYEIPAGGSSVLDQSNGWVLWAYVTFSDNRVAAGESVNLTIYEEGT